MTSVTVRLTDRERRKQTPNTGRREIVRLDLIVAIDASG
jgi:hypothetical protein